MDKFRRKGLNLTNVGNTKFANTVLTQILFSYCETYFMRFLHSRIHSEELSSKYGLEMMNVSGVKADLNMFNRKTKITEYNGSDKSRSHFASFFTKVSSSFSKRIVPISETNDTMQTTTSKNFLKKLTPRRKKNKKTNEKVITCAAV